jgi:hypothetical protein
MRRNRTLLLDPVVGQIERHIPPAAKAAIDFAAVTARLNSLRKKYLFSPQCHLGG